MLHDWNETGLKQSLRINWRASLVPAAAVIPAPIAYIKVVAVKKLVVELLLRRPCDTLYLLCCFNIFPYLALNCVSVWEALL